MKLNRHFVYRSLAGLASLSAVALAGCGSDGDAAPAATGAAGASGGAAVGGAAGAAGAAGGGGGGAGAAGGAALQEVPGCGDGVKLLAAPADPAARGPWPVGARTVVVGGLTVEVWYPAEPGSDAGKAPRLYDLRQWLPASEEGKIPDDAAPFQTCGCHQDLPLDAARGPYPVIVFLHGTAGFRTQSLAHMEHWASRGFVVVAADHPGLFLGDALDFKLTNDLPGDARKLLAALASPAGDVAFLAGRIDMQRVGLAGHSAGGGGIRKLGGEPGVKVIIPLAAGGADPASSLESTLVVGGLEDKVVAYDSQSKGYDASAPSRRLVGISNAGHLFPTDLCWMTNKSGQDIVTTANQYKIKNANLASGLFDCQPDHIPRDTARNIVNHVTTAAFEETLLCKTGNPFDGLQAKFPEVAEFKEELK